MARPRAWHAVSAAEALAALGSDVNGLSDTEARQRLDAHGRTGCRSSEARVRLRRLFAQFRNPLIYTLLAAAAISVGIGHGTDAMVILAVVAGQRRHRLRPGGTRRAGAGRDPRPVEPQASVLRDGRRTDGAGRGVVPGDVVLLEAGDRVPADLRLIQARNLRIDEAVLTGESVPVDKATGAGRRRRRARRPRSRWPSRAPSSTAGQGAGVVVGDRRGNRARPDRRHARRRSRR